MREGRRRLEEIVALYKRLGALDFARMAPSAALVGMGIPPDAVEVDAGSRTRGVILAVPKSGAAPAPPPERIGNVDIVWFIPYSVTPVTLGRVNQCHIVIAERSISSYHCFFRWNDDRSVSLTDRGSSNGAWIDGTRVATMAPWVLKGGEEIILGRFQFRFFYPHEFHEFVRGEAARAA
jgi:pSer/pThr/pTyr-binding forkhead associated (FHA) protein